MNFNNNEVRKVMNVSSRWSSLGKCLERYGTLWDSLMQWDSLESFLSDFDLDDDPTKNNQDGET